MSTRRRGRNCRQELAKQAKKYSSVLVRGFSAGNIAVVDKRSWLEVCDEKHRYGANLRAYYKEWKRYEGPKPGFFEWLDDESIEVEGVPRTKLESETVLYCDPSERQRFELEIRHGLLFRKSTQEIVDTGDDPSPSHPSHEFGWRRVCSNRGGHYRPSEYELLVLLRFLEEHGIVHQDVLVDVQRVQKVARETVNGVKAKKIDSAHFWNAQQVLDFLEMKEWAWRIDLFYDLETMVARLNSRHQSLDLPSDASSDPVVCACTEGDMVDIIDGSS
ncbi:hypothetical protein AC1031_008603 [Aphanomyces cochlioides]|nr:hypothetical protein AC1031_008603 [Aphanomyces cochlioides]